MSSWLSRFRSAEKKWSAFEMGLGMVCGAVIMFFLFFTTAEVVARYFFNRPIHGHVDIICMLSAGMILLAVAYAEMRKANVRVDVLLMRLKRRPYHGVESLFVALSMMPVALMAAGLVARAIFHRQVGQTTDVILLPTWPFLVLAGVGFGVLFIRLVIDLIRHVTGFAGKESKD